MDTKIAIIGAGISGLSAGYKLMKAGFKPVIFEKELFAGGRMSSDRVAGFNIDRGAYTFPEFHQNLRRFIGELGLESALFQTHGTSSTFSEGKEYQIKIGSVKDFLKYKLISVMSKKDMIKLFLYAQSLGKALDIVKPSQKTFNLEKESAAKYLLENYGEQILEKIGYIRVSQRLTNLKPQSYQEVSYILLCANICSNPRIHNSVIRCCD